VTSGPGIWFTAMNLSVHSVMYLYYAAQGLLPRRLGRLCALPVTVAQIAQMVVGSAITALSLRWHREGGATGCHIDPPNSMVGLALYASYCVLFCSLFVDRYIVPSSTAHASVERVCGEDAGGMFHGAGEGRAGGDKKD